MISILICLYGLFILYGSTHELLHSWNTTRTFVAIKLFLILLAYEEPMIDKVVEKLSERHAFNSCFDNVGFIHSGEYVEGKWWAWWIVCLQGIPMMLLLRNAFPVSEIMDEFPEEHVDIVHMAVKNKLVDSTDSEVDADAGSETESDGN